MIVYRSPLQLSKVYLNLNLKAYGINKAYKCSNIYMIIKLLFYYKINDGKSSVKEKIFTRKKNKLYIIHLNKKNQWKLSIKKF